jgi:hypothetical protein
MNGKRECAAAGEPSVGAALQRSMKPPACAALMLLCLGAVHGATAQATDPLQGSACREALAALDTHERRAASAPAAAEAKAALLDARRRAASACLALRDDVPAARSRMAQPPLAALPIAPLPRALPPAAPAPPRAVPAVPPPLTITSCDATGCWSSDGTRLQRVGPELLGPRGFCTTTAGVLNCP